VDGALDLLDALTSDPGGSDLPAAKAAWSRGEWDKLAAIDLAPYSRHHPDLPLLSALKAAGHLQLNDLDAAEEHIRRAQSFGCDSRLIALLMLSAVHNTLGRIAALRCDDSRADEHFASAIALGCETRESYLVQHLRTVNELARLQLLPQAIKKVAEEESALRSSVTRIAERDARLRMLSTELELVNHQLALATKKGQLYMQPSPQRSTGKEEPNNHGLHTKWLEQVSPSQLKQDL